MKAIRSKLLVILLVLMAALATTVSASPLDPSQMRAFHLGFKAEQSIVSGQIVYVLDKESESITRIDLLAAEPPTTAYVINPTAMTLSDDYLVVTSLKRGMDFDTYRFDDDPEQGGSLSMFDPTTLESLNSIALPYDPFSVAVSGNYAIVTAGSGQFTPTISLNLTTGVVVDTDPRLFQRAYLVRATAYGKLFAADTGSFPSDIYTITVDQNTGEIEIQDSPYHGDPEAPMGGNIFPIGSRLLTSGGGIYSQYHLNVISVVEDIPSSIEAAFLDRGLYAAFSNGDGFINILKLSMGNTANEIVASVPAEYILDMAMTTDNVITVVYTIGEHTYVQPIQIESTL